jgi:predicted ATPase/DNA-binding CsgD family transcriptional regulator
VSVTTWSRMQAGPPSARSPLFGRDEEVAAVRQLLGGGARLVTVTGAGGIGKTRVALEVCRQAGGPVSFVELSGTGQDDLPGVLMRTLAPEPHSGRDPVRAIADALASEPRVVVLDTFEHLLASAVVLDELLEACPGLQLLVTSRSRLRLPGENVVPVGALPGGAGSPAVAMFRERAHAVGGLRADDETAVASVCELLEGSPLAIELAAVRTTMFTPAALLAALQSGGQSRLRMLAAGSTAGRHRDMHATIAWSYQLLGEPGRRLLRQLGIFTGSFDLEAAVFAAAGPGTKDRQAMTADVFDQLADLVDWHLAEPAGGPADAPRFRLLDTIREFATEQLSSTGELGASQDGLLAWSMEFAGRAIAGADSPDERRWLERIDHELPNLRTALRLLQERRDVPRGVRLAEALGPFWANRGPMAEGRGWFAVFAALDASEPALSPRTRAAASVWSARLAIDEGELDLDQLAAARDVLVTDPGYVVDWLRATEHLAYGLTMRGELEAADELTVAGLDRATQAGLPYWRCIFLQRRALSAQRHGQPGLAVRYAQETIAAGRAIGYDRIVARAEQIIAHERAAELGAEGARLALLANLGAHEAAGDLRGVVSTMASLGAASIRTDVPGAARWLTDGIDTAVRIGYWHGEAYCVVATIVLLVAESRFGEAARLDDAMQPYLPRVRASLPPAHYDQYRKLAGRARSALLPGAAGLTAIPAGDWATIRNEAHAVTAALAAAQPPGGPPAGTADEEPGGTGAPAGRKARRRGPASNPDLTDRELEVLAAIAGGQTNAQIATALYLSPKTVMHHSTNVYRKLGVRGRAEAVALAYRTGLLGPGKQPVP